MLIGVPILDASGSMATKLFPATCVAVLGTLAQIFRVKGSKTMLLASSATLAYTVRGKPEDVPPPGDEVATLTSPHPIELR
jgi:hypothetical protein